MELLIDRGAAIDLKDNDGNTALILACQNNHENVVKLLVEKSADTSLCNHDGNTALMWASQNGNELIVRFLVDDTCSTSKLRNNQQQYCSEAIVPLCIKVKCEVTVKPADTMTVKLW